MRYSAPVAAAGFDGCPPILAVTEEVLDVDVMLLKDVSTGVALFSVVVLEAPLVAP